MEAIASLLSIVVLIAAWFYTVKKFSTLNVILRHLIGMSVGAVAMLVAVVIFISLGMIEPKEQQKKETDKAEASSALKAPSTTDPVTVISEVVKPESVAALDIFTIKKDEYLGIVKRSVEVSLDREATEEELTAIAQLIYAQRKTDTERTFIGYRLASQSNQGAYWATTHYNPDLKVIKQELFNL